MFVSIIRWLRRMVRRDDGPTAVEYAVMLALIIAVVFISVSIVGNTSKSVFRSSAKAFEHKTDGNADGNGQI